MSEIVQVATVVSLGQGVSKQIRNSMQETPGLEVMSRRVIWTLVFGFFKNLQGQILKIWPSSRNLDFGF